MGVLLSLLLKLDYRDKDKGSSRKFIGILLAYAFANSALSFNYFMSFDKQSFVFFAMSTNVFLITFLIINDFDNLFLAKSYFQSITHLPLLPGDFFKAKLLSACLFISIMLSAVSLPQFIFFFNYENNIAETLLFVFTNLIFILTVASVLVIVYFFILEKFFNKASMFLYAVQICFFSFILYTNTVTRNALNTGTKVVFDNSMLQYLPSYLYSRMVFDPLLPLAGAAVLIIIIYALLKLFSGKFIKVNEIVTRYSIPKTKRKFGIFISRYGAFIRETFLKNNVELASYDLISNQLTNSRFLKTRYFSLLFLPIAFSAIGVITNNPGLLIINEGTKSGFLSDNLKMLSPTLIFMFIIAIRMLISNTKISDENSSGISWLYDVLPVKDKHLYVSGVNKFIYFNMAVPVIVLMAGILLIRLDGFTVLSNLAYIFSAVLFVNTVIDLFDKSLPFTYESNKFNSGSKFGEVFLNMIYGAAIFMLQIFIFKNVIFVLSACAGFLLIVFFLNKSAYNGKREKYSYASN